MKLLKVILLSIVLSGAISTVMPGSSNAQSEQELSELLRILGEPQPCSISQHEAGALIPAGTYSVFLNNFDSIPSAATDIYTRDAEDQCQLIGRVNPGANGLAGQIVTTEEFSTVPIIIVTDNPFQELQIKPEVVLLPVEAPPCSMPQNCLVDYNGDAFSLSPKKVSFSEDSINVGLYSDIGTSSVEEVAYAVNSTVAYTSNKIEPFNKRYIPLGKQQIAIIASLSDGQSLIKREEINNQFDGNLGLYALSLVARWQKTINTVGIFIGALIATLLARLVVQTVHDRRQWKAQHYGGKRSNINTAKTGPRKTNLRYKIGLHKDQIGLLILIPVVMVATYSLITTHVFAQFRVSGDSMKPTLVDGSQRYIYRLPVILSEFNNRPYTPKRGSVIVAQKSSNDLIGTTIQIKKSFFVKRVIALPGETVVFQEGKMLVINAEHPDGFEPDSTFNWVADRTGTYIAPQRIELGEGQLFVVGDNRDGSIDSRAFGPISTSDVFGVVTGT